MEEIVKKKIVITGMGAVTPIGSGVEEYWNRLIAGACGIDKIRQFDATDLAVRIAAEVHSFDLQKYMPKKMIHETDAFTQYAYVAAAEALAMAGKKDGERSGENARMSDDPDRSAGIGLPADPDQMGIVMGTAMAGVATTAVTQEILTNAVHKNVGPAICAADPGKYCRGTNRHRSWDHRSQCYLVHGLRFRRRCRFRSGNAASGR